MLTIYSFILYVSLSQKIKESPQGRFLDARACRSSQDLTFDRQPPTTVQTLPAAPDWTDGTHSQLLWDFKSETRLETFSYITTLLFSYIVSEDILGEIFSTFLSQIINSTDISEWVDMLLADMNPFLVLKNTVQKTVTITFTLHIFVFGIWVSSCKKAQKKHVHGADILISDRYLPVDFIEIRSESTQCYQNALHNEWEAYKRWILWLFTINDSKPTKSAHHKADLWIKSEPVLEGTDKEW